MRFRSAGRGDVDALTSLERVANEKALGHLFAGLDFPSEAVAETWQARLAEPETVIEVVEAPAGLACFVCYDRHRLHHLAVHPERWGTGLARAAVERAAGRMDPEPVLWCLRDNVRARGMYEHLGWVLTGRTGTSLYPPYHPEVEYTLRRPRG